MGTDFSIHLTSDLFLALSTSDPENGMAEPSPATGYARVPLEVSTNGKRPQQAFEFEEYLPVGSNGAVAARSRGCRETGRPGGG